MHASARSVHACNSLYEMMYSCTSTTNLRLWRRPGQGGLGGLGTPTCVKPDMYSQHLNRRLNLGPLLPPILLPPCSAPEELSTTALSNGHN